MAVNSNRPERWKRDVAQSIDLYNDWFMRFAPEAYRTNRAGATELVLAALKQTAQLTQIDPALLIALPAILPVLRMATAPPIARDRLIGLAGVSPVLVRSMELLQRIPPKTGQEALAAELQKICHVIRTLVDKDIFPWVAVHGAPTEQEVYRAATVVADRLCNAATDPIIRNAQEQRQLALLKQWLESRGYEQITGSAPLLSAMTPGKFAFRVLVWFTKEKPPTDHQVEVSYGGKLTEPSVVRKVTTAELEQSAKWTQLTEQTNNKPLYANGAVASSRLADFFTIKRGVATGGNSFFILTAAQITEYQLPTEFWTPILPSPRFLPADEITADEQGNPQIVPQLFLLTCSLPEATVRDCYPTLWRYLQVGVEQGIDQRYLAQHRTPWYAQEQRQPTPFFCTYMGRQTDKGGAPFRFILNHSQAIAPNVYLMLYPKPILQRSLDADPALMRTIWQILNAINPALLTSEGRIYGGGLHKIEPRELANTSAEMIFAILPTSKDIDAQQLSLF